MTRSVSTLGRSIGAAGGGSRGHRRRHEVRAGALALASLEVAVRGGGHALALARGLAVHAHAHRAAGLAPLEARVAEDPIETLALGGVLHQARARHDPRR